jgi:hypothetical protein
MKRIQDKIKDLVEPQSFEQVGNFAADPAQALAAYRFTDMNSDLLSRWLDALADMQHGAGCARALAGARGVGKSHTLAVFGALAGSERLRSNVTDAHVGTSARRLSGRRCSLARVERGTRPTLAEELAAAMTELFGGSELQWGSDAAEILTVAASRATGETLVVIIDTAFNRPARVARDDGPALGAIAATARGLNVFLALALDDDIAGADGANIALAGTYQIDYLDPENLYRVADQFVLRKRPKVGDTLREIYHSLRASVHDFNWSESRFAALYPVHPLVAELAPGVRLYVPAFAFLPFAASAAARATARPALALVLLDEVFDATETALRDSSELRDTFEIYDQLTEYGIGQLPIMQRYQARLVLKSLFVLSLDGRGATPREMCAALLLTDEAGGDAAARVGETLARFTEAAAPVGIDRSVGADGETRYCFHIAAREAHEDNSVAFINQKSADEKRSVDVKSDAEKIDVDESVVDKSFADESVVDESFAGESLVDESVVDERVVDESEAVRSEVVVNRRSVDESVAFVNERSAVEAGSLDAEAVEWARRLTEGMSLGAAAGLARRDEVSAALALWLNHWRARGLRQKFESLPDGCLTTRVWKAAAEVRKSFGSAASSVEALLAGKLSLEEALANVAAAFKSSAETFARRAQTLEDLTEFVEGFAERERVRAYITTAEPTELGEVESARRELFALAEDQNNFLLAERRERFQQLWGEFRVRYCEHYAAVHDKTMCAVDVRAALRELRRGERWREFESLSRLPVVSSQVWRQAEDLLRTAEGGWCGLNARRLLEAQPVCACRFRLSRAAEVEELPQELESLMEHGLAVYRRTLLMLGANLAISLDAIARRSEDEVEAQRARALSSAFALERVPERLTRLDVQLIARALQRMPAPPPVRVVAPNGDAGLLTREELRARFTQWLDELPERPVLIEVVSKAEMNAP